MATIYKILIAEKFLDLMKNMYPSSIEQEKSKPIFELIIVEMLIRNKENIFKTTKRKGNYLKNH